MNSGTRATEAAKTTLVDKAATLAETALGAVPPARARRFVAELYEHVPPADIGGRDPVDLCGAAASLWRLAATRKPGTAAVRVFNPRPADDGWGSTRTIVAIVNDDMPFLVDSVHAAITGAGHEVGVVIHPVVTVARDAGGALVELDPATGGARESWMLIEIGREPHLTAIDELMETIGRVLGDVRAAVTDWPAMRAALRGLAGGLATQSLPVPKDEVAEDTEFLRWLDDGNLTLLGFRDFPLTEGDAPKSPPLGILRGDTQIFGALRDFAALPRDVQRFLQRRELLVITKTNTRATVHRAARMDAIGIRRFDSKGEVIGVSLFVGLFTSRASGTPPRTIPIVRRKIERVVARAGMDPAGHDGKALLHILDGFPRDELFQIDADALYDTAIGVLNLQERQRFALFVRPDPLQRFASCVVYAPRDRYDTDLRQRFGGILAEAFAGSVIEYFLHLDESPLARVQYIVRTRRGAVPRVDLARLEERLVEAGRGWTDRLESAAAASWGEDVAKIRLRMIAPFPTAYRARTTAEQAIADLDRVGSILAGAPLEASLHPRADDGGAWGLRLYRRDEPVALSDVLPLLENLGLRIVAEEPYRIESALGPAVWIDAFTLAPGAIPAKLPDALREKFEAALVAIWQGEIENDGFNRLILSAGLSARQTVILRLYCKILRQAGSAYSQAYMEETLSRHPAIAARLVRLFEERFALDRAQRNDNPAIRAIERTLDQVESLDEDRILRGFLNLIGHSLRTNYYQRLADGGPKPYLSVKLASREIDLFPLPRPLYEIYVYSPRMEGVHMRAGRVARGGIRWSDRKEDFRREILGLMKAQTVKNAVIVPVGSKGGFVLKRPVDRARLQEEGIACYRILMRGLLDITDTIGAGQSIVPPPDVVRLDGDDPYLVVAADKGTATFSDFANEIAIEYGFWLGDAFASGGSAGYDHKEIGITSRGAWELVKRHFRELGRDIQSEDFTVIGVGDMAGDVFGNAMLRSPHIRLLGAFNHLHIFIDPSPDPAAGFIERQRLFDLPRSSWTDYDKTLISKGGGVFDRSLKSIPLSSEAKAALGIAEDALPPAELIRRLLTAPVDLLFFGGIGTFVKARAESHLDVGDRTNDALRIDAETIRATVVGEGANLGVTQKGRIAYALKGGLIDTDAIDNSAGVSMSDHEVNIKILLGHAIAEGALEAPAREPLLAQMTDEVAALVLRDNLQGIALSVAEAQGPAALDRQIRMMRELERAGRLDRAIEFLPDDETLASRERLTRPELSVLLAYAKMSLDEDLLASTLPEQPEFGPDLAAYFPPELQTRFADQINTHPLRREIVATTLANDLVNRAGLTFIHDLAAQTGRSSADITSAYRITRAVFDLPALWQAIEALDGMVATEVQYRAAQDLIALIEHAALWLLRNNRLDFARETARLGNGARHLAAALPDLLTEADHARLATRAEALAKSGVPGPFAHRLAGTGFLASALEIAELAERTRQPVDRAARIYYAAGARFALDEMRTAARRLPADTPWQKTAADTVIDDLFALQTDLAARILAQANGTKDPVAAWSKKRDAALAPAEAAAAELRAAATPDLAMLVVATRQLRQAIG
jgi:glutamate dehydrogenase